MKVFLAGASGAIGRRLVPQLIAAGHEVAGTTRRAEAAAAIEAQGATPVVLDVYDGDALQRALNEQAPDVVIHQLTDLSTMDYAANGRLRSEGTPKLVAAARAAGVERMIAQSIAWLYEPADEPAGEDDPLDESAGAYPGVSALERAVASMPHGVVLRYGALYGPGTWYAPDGAIAEQARRGELPATPAWSSFVHVEDAAAAAVAALAWPAGTVNVVDDEPARGSDWVPAFCEAVGAPQPAVEEAAAASGRPVSNVVARALGWQPGFPSWRDGFARQGEPVAG